MVLIKRKKFPKDRKSRNKGLSLNGYLLSFGNFGLKAISRGNLTVKQIESARRVISKYVKKNGRLWIKVCPDKSITKKPIDTRMGGGKGPIEYYIFKVKPGRILYEISGVHENLARKIFKLASFKLPFKTIFVK